jgi:hypothetical protein
MMVADSPAIPHPRGMLQIVVRHRELLMTVTAIAVVLGATYNYVWLPLHGQFAGNLDDFGSRPDLISSAPGILGGASQHARGADPYGPFLSYTATQQTAMAPFCQTPILIFLMRPFLLLSRQWQENVWLWMELASVVAGSLLVASVSLPRDWPWRRIALIVPLLFAPATYNLWHGNVNAIIFFVNALALVAWTRGWQVRCGVFIGIGAAIKIAPIAMLVLFIRRRWWKGAVAAGALELASIVVAVAYASAPVVREFFLQVVPVLQREDGWYFNQSGSAVLSRVAEHSVTNLDPPIGWLHVLVVVVDAALLALTAWAVRSGRAAPSRRTAEFGLGIAALLLVGGTTWYAHHIQVLVPVAAAVAWLTTSRVRRSAILWAVALVVVVDALLAPWFLAHVAPTLNPGAIQADGLWWAFLQLVSLPALSVLGLYAALLSALRSERPLEPSSLRPARC